VIDSTCLSWFLHLAREPKSKGAWVRALPGRRWRYGDRFELSVRLHDRNVMAVEPCLAQEGCASASEHLRNLIRVVQKRLAKQELEDELLEQPQSPASEITDAD